MEKEKEYRFKFSIVTAVYNVEVYLKEAVESIINQDIGFKESVQMILVNDGSTDRSGEICNLYQEKYPDNIMVIHKENGGVSSARNEGLKYAEGRYVNFMDPDDMLTADTLSAVYDYFVRVDKDVDLVSIPEEYFERHSGPHPLNYKYNSGKNEVIDLWTKYNYVQMSVASSFFKNRSITQKQFDSSLKYAEDAKVILEILFDKSRFGVVPKGKYMYRLRSTDDSALSKSKSCKGWYLDYLKFYTHWAIQSSLKNFGFVPKFVQYNIMYDMQWRFRLQEIPEGVLTEEEKAEFISLLKEAVNYIDDSIIFEQKRLSRELKDYIIGIKSSSGTAIQDFFNGDARIRYSSTGTVTHALSSYPAKFKELIFESEGIRIRGFLLQNAKFQEKAVLLAKLESKGNEIDLDCSFYENEELASRFAGMILARAVSFDILIPYNVIQDISTLKLFVSYGSYTIKCKNQVPEEGFPFIPKSEQDYYYCNNYIIRMPRKSLILEPAGTLKHLKKEFRLRFKK